MHYFTGALILYLLVGSISIINIGWALWSAYKRPPLVFFALLFSLISLPLLYIIFLDATGLGVQVARNQIHRRGIDVNLVTDLPLYINIVGASGLIFWPRQKLTDRLISFIIAAATSALWVFLSLVFV